MSGFAVIGVAQECGAHHHGVSKVYVYIVFSWLGVGVVDIISSAVARLVSYDVNTVIELILVISFMVIGCAM